MKQILVIGSAVVDVILRVPHLPAKGEDINIPPSTFALGGCACNVWKALRRFNTPALLCSPVGRGVYGRMVEEYLAVLGQSPFVRLEEENGCCYCLVEDDGERSFISSRGAEYRFSKAWMSPDKIDYADTDSVFICGIDVEDPTGEEIISFINEQKDLEVYFSPGPRIMKIDEKKMDAILERRPFLHLSIEEAAAFTGKKKYEAAARVLAGRTGNSVVITLGEQGCYYLGKDGESGLAPAYPAEINTIAGTTGAGDAHCGALIARLKKGGGLPEACGAANRAAAELISGEIH